MDEKRKGESSDSLEADVAEKVIGSGGNWFWKMMKEREKARSAQEELNWLWKAMKERQDVRTHAHRGETYSMDSIKNREPGEGNEDL